MGTIAVEGGFQAELADTRGAIEGIRQTLPRESAERSGAELLQALAAEVVRIELETAAFLWETSQVLYELHGGIESVRRVEAAPAPESSRLRVPPHAEVAAKVVVGIQPELRAERNGNGAIEVAGALDRLSRSRRRLFPRRRSRRHQVATAPSA